MGIAISISDAAEMGTTNQTERPSSRDQLASWYAAALKEQAASGLSIAEFAAELGVSAATLYQWRRRLADAVDGSVATESSAPELIEVVLGGSQRVPRGPSPASLTVRLPGSREIEIPSGFDAEALQRVVRALESC